jgi:hypothetical protein
MKNGHRVLENLKGTNLDKDAKVQKFLKEEVTRLIKDLKI